MVINSRGLMLLGGVTALVMAMALIATLHAVEFDRGAALFENHCSSCHDTQAHALGKTNHVVTLADLHARVAAWSIHSGLSWSEEDVNDVTTYLDRRFYQFTEQP